MKIWYEINSNPTQKEKLQKGDSIKFSSGAFTELIAKVESVEEKNRIWVLLEAMGGYQRLKLQNVEKNKYIKF
jgi:transcription antitermination factor NusG